MYLGGLREVFRVRWLAQSSEEYVVDPIKGEYIHFSWMLFGHFVGMTSSSSIMVTSSEWTPFVW
jgi:hypothetical protein